MRFAGKRKARLEELRSSEKTKLSCRYALLASQYIHPMCGKLRMRVAEDLQKSDQYFAWLVKQDSSGVCMPIPSNYAKRRL